jgi:hypothetical protein
MRRRQCYGCTPIRTRPCAVVLYMNLMPSLEVLSVASHGFMLIFLLPSVQNLTFSLARYLHTLVDYLLVHLIRLLAFDMPATSNSADLALQICFGVFGILSTIATLASLHHEDSLGCILI